MSQRLQRAYWIATLTAALSMLAGCSSDADAERRGAELFDLHCAACHEGPTPGLKVQPPNLRGLFKAKQLPSGAPATDDRVRKTIVEGLRTMPAFNGRLNNAELDDLIKYLHIVK